MFGKKNIYKYCHRPVGLPAFLFPMGCMKANKTYTVERNVEFCSNCEYDLKNEDQYDWNKLFGVCFGLTGIHKNSIRFGWRWNIEKGAVEICSIVYDHGIPSRKYLNSWDMELEAEANFKIDFQISEYGLLCYEFYINDEIVDNGTITDIPSKHYYGCGFYFGGNKRAPHKVSAYIA